jgi:uncharacterized damage-inducible protein DinB
MTMIEMAAEEFAHETATTRRHLERLPEDRLAWRPHEKSFAAGALGSHLVECVRWTDAIFGADGFDFDPATFTPFEAGSVADLLAAFDEGVSRGRERLEGATEAMLAQPWRFSIMGRERFARPRAVVFRDFTLSHLIHHRGQLSVYLRLLGVPVPGSYGPTADEPG